MTCSPLTSAEPEPAMKSRLFLFLLRRAVACLGHSDSPNQRGIAHMPGAPATIMPVRVPWSGDRSAMGHLAPVLGPVGAIMMTRPLGGGLGGAGGSGGAGGASCSGSVAAPKRPGRGGSCAEPQRTVPSARSPTLAVFSPVWSHHGPICSTGPLLSTGFILRARVGGLVNKCKGFWSCTGE